MRILALDVGTKRIGIALSDELGFTAQGLSVLECKDADTDIRRIGEIVDEHQVTEIVVGLPLNMDGSIGPQAISVRELIALLTDAVKVPIVEWDERLTTAAAERTLLEADLSRAKRKKVRDKLAAVMILQGYLDSKYFKGLREQ